MKTLLGIFEKQPFTLATARALSIWILVDAPPPLTSFLSFLTMQTS